MRLRTIPRLAEDGILRGEDIILFETTDRMRSLLYVLSRLPSTDYLALCRMVRSHPLSLHLPQSRTLAEVQRFDSPVTRVYLGHRMEDLPQHEARHVVAHEIAHVLTGIDVRSREEEERLACRLAMSWGYGGRIKAR